MAHTDSTPWKGVLIAESLENGQIPHSITTVKTKNLTLEGEEKRGIFHFHNVEIKDKDVTKVLESIKKDLLDRWYFHMVKGDELIVIFKGKSFTAHKGNNDEVEEIRRYGISQGILEEQLGLERLFESPYDE
jgi:hypothetical protein